MTTSIPRVKAIWAEGTSLTGDIIIGDRDSASGLPWPHTPADLKHFREETRGHTLIMGKGTFDKLPAILKTRESTKERPLIVLTNQIDAVIDATPGAIIQPLSWVYGANEANALLGYLANRTAHLWSDFAGKPVAVIGGTKVIELFEPFYDELVVTHIRGFFKGDVKAPSDTFFDDFRTTDRKRIDGGHVIARMTRKEH